MRYAIFVALMLAINLIDSAIVRSILDPHRRMLVAAAGTFDVVAVVCLLYYWLLVRPGLRARGGLVVVALAGMVHATYFFPEGLAARGVLAGMGEFGLVGFVIFRIRRSRSAGSYSGDPVEGIARALAGVVAVPGLARMLTTELSVMYYALLAWRAKPHVPQGMRPFTIHKRAGQAFLFGALPFVCLLEIVPTHVVLKHWSSMAAWIGTGVSLYGAIWLVGISRAFRLRPTLVGREKLSIRYGLLFELRVRKEFIASVRAATTGDREFSVPRRSQATVCIELVQPMDATGPFGFRKRMDRVAVKPDDEAEFLAAVESLLVV